MNTKQSRPPVADLLGDFFFFPSHSSHLEMQNEGNWQVANVNVKASGNAVDIPPSGENMSLQKRNQPYRGFQHSLLSGESRRDETIANITRPYHDDDYHGIVGKLAVGGEEAHDTV